MKGIICLVLVTLISVTYGTFCNTKQLLNDPCGSKGKCATPICVLQPTTAPTTPAPGPTVPVAESASVPGATSTAPTGATSTASSGANAISSSGANAISSSGANAISSSGANATASPAATSAAGGGGTGSGRKRRATTVATCSPECTPSTHDCKYQCTGQSGSIKHGLSPLVLVVGVITKLFLIG